MNYKIAKCLANGTIFSCFLGLANYLLLSLFPNLTIFWPIPVIIWVEYLFLNKEMLFNAKWIPTIIGFLCSYELAFLYVGIFEQNTLLASIFNQLSLIYTLFFCSKPFRQSELDFNINRFLCNEIEKRYVLKQSILVFAGCAILGTTFKYVQLPIRLEAVCMISWIVVLACFSSKTYASFRKTKWLSVWVAFSIIVGILYPLLINQYPFASTLLSDGFLIFSILLFVTFK